MAFERVEVSARWERSGKFFPRKVYWQEKVYPVESIGRSWEDVEGFHVLCMISGGQVAELLFRLNPAEWFMRLPSAPGRMV
jgi:hypothetical protein